MATAGKDSLANYNKLLECPICFTSMVTLKPRALACLHTFCETCLERIAEGESQICCPTCWKYTSLPAKGVEALPVNFFISQLSTCPPSSTEVACKICSTDGKGFEAARGRCTHCDCSLCDTCIARHLTLEAYADHEITNIEYYHEKNTTTCEKHQVTVTLYCKTCKEYLCFKCGLEKKHTGHEYALENAGKALERETETLSDKVSAFKLKLDEEVGACDEELERCNRVEETIKIEGDKRKQMIDEEVEKLISSIHLSNKVPVSQARKRVSVIISELQQESRLDPGILKTKNSIKEIQQANERFEVIQEKFNNLCNWRAKSLQFVAATTDIQVGNLDAANVEGRSLRGGTNGQHGLQDDYPCLDNMASVTSVDHQIHGVSRRGRRGVRGTRRYGRGSRPAFAPEGCNWGGV